MTMPTSRPDSFEAMLRSVLREQADVETPVRLRAAVMGTVADRTWERRRIAAPLGPAPGTGGPRHARRISSLFTATRFVVAGLIVALFGGFLLAGVLTLRLEDRYGPLQAAVSPSAEPTATPSPSSGGATPPPCPPEWDPPDRHILWETPSARLEADSFEMRRGDCFWSGVGPIVDLQSDPGDPEYRTLEVEWEEQGATQRINFYFRADETHWWLDAGSLIDPSAPDEDQLLRTLRGETFEGDVHLVGPPDLDLSLTIKGLRLTAFAPGTGPAPLTDCRHVPGEKRQRVRRRLIRAGILEMAPKAAERMLRRRGLCFTFRFDYPFPPDDEGGASGYSERWCTAPPGRKVSDLGFLPGGELVAFVGTREPRPRRTQPPEGWNCQADTRGATHASPSPIPRRPRADAGPRDRGPGTAVGTAILVPNVGVEPAGCGSLDPAQAALGDLLRFLAEWRDAYVRGHGRPRTRVIAASGASRC